MELIRKKKDKKMGLPLAKPKAATRRAATAIQELTKALDIKETMLAALLRVTERTVANWKDKDLDQISGSRGRRLVALDYAVLEARAAGVKDKQLLNLLDQPFDPESDESGTILGFIVDDVEPKALNPLIKKQIQDFLRK